MPGWETQLVHVVPVGGAVDTERVVAPVRDQGGDVVHLLFEDGAVPESALATLRSRLADQGVDVEETTYGVGPDTPEIYTVFGLVTTIADRYDGEADFGDSDAPAGEVYVNVSVGTKRTAIGAALGCLDDSTRATAYFVDEDGHVADAGDAAERAAAGYTYSDVPDYPIDSPGRDAVALLAIVACRNTTQSPAKKRTLVDRSLRLTRALDTGLDFAERIRKDSEAAGGADAIHRFDDLTPDDKRGSYRRLDQPLDALVAEDCVTVETVGRSKVVRLTETGEQTLRAFRHKVTDVVAELAGDPGTDPPDWLTEGL